MERSLILKAFTDNPIVLRDLRTTMRGTRSYWFQGTYLLLLGVLAVTGYAIATGQSLLPQDADSYSRLGPRVFSVVDAQDRLQSFYYFIFVTLAALITLIAPALTATSVTDERQRQSLDLLVTTPISAFEMLVGKLMSSLAFLGLLLALSLPASALCILLGGATIGDVFRIYTLLGVDAIVLASIGLYFSCACKNSLQAIVWTYASALTFTAVMFGISVSNYGQGPTFVGDVAPSMAIGALSPLTAIFPIAGQNIVVGPLSIPVWVSALVTGFLTVRLILTAATYRFGVFGGDAARSLRKQLLVISALVTLIFGYSLGTQNGLLNRDIFIQAGETTTRNEIAMFTSLLIALLGVALPFLPGLFVPVKSQDAPPGETQAAQAERDSGTFRFGAMLLPRHAGALPYFLTWWSTSVFGGWLGFALSQKQIYPVVNEAILYGSVYAVGAAILLWGLSRLAATWVQSATGARALAFGLLVLAVVIPALPMTLISITDAANGTTTNVLTESPLSYFWLGSPMLHSSELSPTIASLLISGTFAAFCGVVVGIFAQRRKA